ncbi:MAG TPA: GNAT family N-acetyltransferase [Candidatus Limnocylindrales bacterium]|nr:GNAT family N-acetyltransferase [Candidatus Limnocylindrales bacterium]
MTRHDRPTGRQYADEADFWRVRAFLRELLLEADRRFEAWHVLRWDYWRHHGIENCEWQDLRTVVRLWETEDGRLDAVVTAEGRGNAFPLLRPGIADEGFRHELLDAAETNDRLDRGGAAGSPLTVWVPSVDPGWIPVLTARGYEPAGLPEDLRTASLDRVPAGVLPAGYSIRPVRDEDFPARGVLSLVVFHPEPDGSDAMSLADYRNVQRCPLYRRDLDLVAVGPEGDLAGFTTAWFDDVTRTGFFEPVGVHPSHRRRGVALALLAEGMRRLAWYGAELAYTASYGPEVGAVYEAAGLRAGARLLPWRRNA